MISPYRLSRVLIAVAVVISPILLGAWFALCPQYGNPQCPTSANTLAALVAFRSADPTLMSVFLTISTVIPYVYPLSYIGLGLLAFRRSPRLAIAGIMLGWFGSIAWGLIGPGEFIYYDAAHLGNDQLATTLLNGLYGHWQIYYIVATGWVIGHQGAYILLGAALWRAKAIPKWAALLLIVSGPIMGPIAYGSNVGWIQVGGYVLVLIASVPVAIKLAGKVPVVALTISETTH